MKKVTLRMVVWCLSFLLVACTSEDLISPENNVAISDQKSKALSSHSTDGYMIGALVQGSYCGFVEGGATYQYTVYATNNPPVNYDRTVNISIYKTTNGRSFEIDGGDVIIPANSTVSNNKIVFSGANTERYGNVNVEVLMVSDDTGQDISHLYTLVNNLQNADNCYVADLDVPGEDPDFCNGEDADGDGICDWNDPDFGEG